MISPGTPLNRDRVLRAAIALADEGGLEALSMRGLARSLGVEAMSLYRHVASKGDLVAGMVDLVVGEIELPTTADWAAAIRECAISAYDVLLAHPWACSQVMATGSLRIEERPRLRYMEWMLGRLRDTGLSPELIYHAYHALDSHVLGFTMWHLGHSAGALHATDDEDFFATIVPELRAGGFPNLADHAEQHLAAPSGDTAREFEFGLDLILDGLEKMR